MKLLLFSYVFRPESFLVNELADELTLRHEVTVYTGLPNYPRGEFFPGYGYNGPFHEKFDRVSVIRYPMIPRKSGFFNLALNYLTHLMGAMLKLIQTPQVDVYFVYATSPLLIALPAILLKKFRRRPLVIWYQDLWPESFVAVTKSSNSLVVALLTAVTRWIYRNTDLMLISSEGFRENLDRLGYTGKTAFIPNWAPEIVGANANLDWLPQIPAGHTVITFAGNIGKAQALDTLLDCAQKLKSSPVVFLIVGEGRERARLEKAAQELGLANVFFCGQRSLQDMPALFKRSDFLYVSLAEDALFALTLPSKLQSYMAAGKPLIVSLAGEGAELVRKAECGFSARPESAEELILAVEKALKLSQVERESLGLKARRYYQAHFDKRHVLSRLEKEIEKLLK